LVGVVFLVYERSEQRRQDELAWGLSGAGAGGIVDHIVDVEVALALLAAPGDPAAEEPTHWATWQQPGKPLRWLREGRPEILCSPTDPQRDPRRYAITPETQLVPWGRELIDQAIRRLLAAMRDWTPLIGASQEGTAALLLLSRVRTELMRLHEMYPSDSTEAPPKQVAHEARMLATNLRIQTRILALAFEQWSGAEQPRREVMETTTPLPPVWPGFEGAGNALNKHLRRAAEQLGFGVAVVDLEGVREFARRAHAGQVDKLDRDYFAAHLQPVAEKLRAHGTEAEMAGLLHDVLEDTAVTAQQLLDVGIPKRVVRAVESVTKRDGEPYENLIRRAAVDNLGRLVKLADNELNLESNSALAATDPEKAAQLLAKYEAARKILLDP
ncbi:MAG TPA: hypothetical protein PKL71_05835, partial [Marmoricola sp.]|nr:hypothetical protein [Marmoricola sp.]